MSTYKALVDHLHRKRKRVERATVQALVGLHVQFISLVPNPANKRRFIVKALRAGRGGGPGGLVVVQRDVRVLKASKKRQMLYGIVLAPDELDDEKDTISKVEIEKAAYLFMRNGRLQQIDADHDGAAQKGFVAESWIVRKGDALFPGEAVGSWAVGIKVEDKAVWKRVDEGKLLGFSVAGIAKRQPVKVDFINKDREAKPMGKAANIGLASALVTAVLEQEGFLEEGPTIEVEKEAVAPALTPGQEQIHADTQAMLDLLTNPDDFVEHVVKALQEAAEGDEELAALLKAEGITGLFDDEDVAKALPRRSRAKVPADTVTARVGRRRRGSTRSAATPGAGGLMQDVLKSTPLGDRLSKARDDQDLTIKEMAEWADRSPSTMGAILKGEIEDPPDEVLKALAAHLTGVSAKMLMKLRDDHVEAGVKKAGPDDGDDLEEVTLEIPVRREVTVEKAQAGEVADGAGTVSVEKYYLALDAAEVETEQAVGKGASFKERMLKNQLWTITSALSDALRDVLGDKLVKNKIKAVRMVVDEFVEWLEEQVGDAVKKDDVIQAVLDGVGGDDVHQVEDEQGLIIEAVQKQTDLLSKVIGRLQRLEKQHPGRQSLMGGEDVDDDGVVKAQTNGRSGKGFKGLNINLGP